MPYAILKDGKLIARVDGYKAARRAVRMLTVGSARHYRTWRWQSTRRVVIMRGSVQAMSVQEEL